MNILLIIFGVLLFNFIVFAHEFGHFFWAKKFGVKVNEFALGMGPRILKFQRGETIFSLRLFPIGGFCDMEGEDEKSDDPRSFETKPAWQKAIIIAFGGIMNIIVGFIMTMIILAPKQAFLSTTISKFDDNAVSCTTGLQVDDTITKIDGSTINTYKDISFNLTVDKKTAFDIEVLRNGERINLKNVTFKTLTDENGEEIINLDFYVKGVENNLWNLIKQAFWDTISTIKIVWSSLIRLVTGRISVRNMSGPIGIASVIGKASSEGLKTSIWTAIANIVYIMAMITINLGIFNLLPLPALDGGRLLILIFEMITRKKINPKYEAIIHGVGFALFVLFMLYMSYSDIAKLFGR